MCVIYKVFVNVIIFYVIAVRYTFDVIWAHGESGKRTNSLRTILLSSIPIDQHSLLDVSTRRKLGLRHVTWTSYWPLQIK